MPVSVSTSTTATWEPKGKVGLSALKSVSASRPPSPAAAATSAQDFETAGVPRTWKAPLALVQLDVEPVGLEQVRGEPASPVEHLARRLEDGRAAELQRAGAERAHAPGHLVGVTVADRDLLERDAEGVGDEHGEAGVVALPVGAGAGVGGGRAVVVHDHATELLPAWGPAVTSTYTDTPMPSCTGSPASPAGLLGAELLVAGGLEGHVEASLVVAHVVDRAGGGGVGEVVGGDQVATTHLGRVHADLGGEEVHGALDGRGCLRTGRRRGRRRWAWCW